MSHQRGPTHCVRAPAKLDKEKAEPHVSSIRHKTKAGPTTKEFFQSQHALTGHECGQRHRWELGSDPVGALISPRVVLVGLILPS